MKLKAILTAATLLFGTSALAEADAWVNRAQTVTTAEKLQEQVEIFDESLHGITAPAEVVELAHHFEETVAEFVEISKTATRAEATEELRHMNEDVQLIQQRLSKSDMPKDPIVRSNWFAVRDEVRRINRQLRLWNR